MARPLVIHDGLTVEQREVARLESLGLRVCQIADKTGLNYNTISRWRKEPLYQDHVVALMDEMDRATIQQARAVRNKALDAVVKAVDRMSDLMADDELSANETASLSRATLDIYKTLAAQTGIKEVSGVEHSVAANPRELVSAAVAQLRDRQEDE